MRAGPLQSFLRLDSSIAACSPSPTVPSSRRRKSRPSCSDTEGSAARFNLNRQVTTDGTNLYLADRQNHKIRSINILTGATSTLAGPDAGTTASGLVNQPGSSARFTQPEGVATDGTSVFVADTGNNVIRKIDIATRAVSTLAGSGGSGDAVQHHPEHH